MTDALLAQPDQMEALSRAYAATVAASAGYALSHPDFDRDSVDVIIHAGGTMRPQIGVQLKATKAIPVSATSFTHPLKIKNYNDLRAETQFPRILVVLALPKLSHHWVDLNPKRLIMKRCAFWKSLLGAPESSNTVSVSVEMDTTQVFDPAALTALMDKSRKGVPL